MTKQNKRYQKPVYILVGNGFSEQETVACVEKMRRTDVPVSLVGITCGLVTGQHGLKIKPEYSLEEVKVEPLPKMVIIPNGLELYLATDPRIHCLVNNVLDNHGLVAAMSTAEPFLYQYSKDKISQFNLQGRLVMGVFIDQLVDIAV